MAATSSHRERNMLRDDEILPYLEELLDRCDESEGDISDGDDIEENGNTSAIAPLPLLQDETESDSDESEEESEVPLPNAPRCHWQRRSFKPPSVTISQPTLPPTDTSNYKYDDYFRQYLDDDILQLIVEKTCQTYTKVNGGPLGLDLTELKKFIGICLIMSCLQYPIIRMYWDNRWRIPVVSDNMSRNRFFVIRTSLKVVFDDDVKEEERRKDRLWKLRPLITKITEVCLKQEKEADVAVDEMMVPFSGTSSLKQYCPNKPNPVGLKVFVIANPNGLVIDFTFYQGKTTYPDYTNQGFGLGESAVIQLTESLTPGHSIYHDRFFTSLKLVRELLKRGFTSTGTIQKKRIPKEARLKTDKELTKAGRGSSDMLVQYDENICLIKWMDRKSVMVMSSAHGVDPTDKCLRYSKKDKTRIEVTRPKAIQEYNAKMGEVDLFDRMLSYCPMRARTKKWTIRTIFHLIDMAVVNSWIQFKMDQIEKRVPSKNIPQLRKYKLMLGEALLFSDSDEVTNNAEESEQDEEEQPSTKRRKVPVPLPHEYVRKSRSAHMPAVSDVKDWQKCRRQGCRERTRTQCTTCNIFLCLTLKRNCFKIFHEN